MADKANTPATDFGQQGDGPTEEQKQVGFCTFIQCGLGLCARPGLLCSSFTTGAVYNSRRPHRDHSRFRVTCTPCSLLLQLKKVKLPQYEG